MEVCDDATVPEVESEKTTQEGDKMPDAIPTDPVVPQTGPEPEEDARQGQKVRACFKNKVLRHLDILENEIAALKKLVEGAETLESCCPSYSHNNGTGAKKTGSSNRVATLQDGALAGEASCSRDPDVVELVSSDDDCAVLCNQPRGVPNGRPRPTFVQSNGSTRTGGHAKRCRGGPTPLPSQEVTNPARLWLEIKPMCHGYLLTWDHERHRGGPKPIPVDHFEVFFSGEHRSEGRVIDWELLEERPDKGVLIGNLKPELKYFFSVKGKYQDGTEGKFSNIVKSD